MTWLNLVELSKLKQFSDILDQVRKSFLKLISCLTIDCVVEMKPCGGELVYFIEKKQN